ncbi:hypothetical protein [Nonomuraea dietziae]|uniref:hypothetical protein n=1 Tax=Nonomuraea dietziae TaxID=65515 RepID=UPI0031CF85D6
MILFGVPATSEVSTFEVSGPMHAFGVSSVVHLERLAEGLLRRHPGQEGPRAETIVSPSRGRGEQSYQMTGSWCAP